MAYTTDANAAADVVNFIFDTVEIDGMNLGEIFPDARMFALSDVLDSIVEGYEWMGLDVEPIEAQVEADNYIHDMWEAEMNEYLDWEAVADEPWDGDMNSFVTTRTNTTSDIAPFAIAGAALVAGGLYFFNRKAAPKGDNTSAFLSN